MEEHQIKRGQDLMAKVAHQIRYRILGANEQFHVWEPAVDPCGFKLEVYSQSKLESPDAKTPGFILGPMFCKIIVHTHANRASCNKVLGDITAHSMLGGMPFTVAHPDYLEHVVNHVSYLFKKMRRGR